MRTYKLLKLSDAYQIYLSIKLRDYCSDYIFINLNVTLSVQSSFSNVNLFKYEELTLLWFFCSIRTTENHKYYGWHNNLVTLRLLVFLRTCLLRYNLVFFSKFTVLWPIPQSSFRTFPSLQKDPSFPFVVIACFHSQLQESTNPLVSPYIFVFSRQFMYVKSYTL